MAEALRATVVNMFSKGQNHQYPAEPFPITADEQQERHCSDHYSLKSAHCGKSVDFLGDADAFSYESCDSFESR